MPIRIPDPKKHRNPDGTYNGVSYMSELSGLSQAEIRWTWDRMKALLAEGKSKDDAKAIVKEEGRKRPWEQKRVD